MREATTKAMPLPIVEEERQSRRGRPAATRRADGVCGRSHRCSSSTMSTDIDSSSRLDLAPQAPSAYVAVFMNWGTKPQNRGCPRRIGPLSKGTMLICIVNERSPSGVDLGACPGVGRDRGQVDCRAGSRCEEDALPWSIDNDEQCKYRPAISMLPPGSGRRTDICFVGAARRCVPHRMYYAALRPIGPGGACSRCCRDD